jgi:hypothetical protein
MYVRPMRPAAPRILTTTKTAGGTAPPACDFLAIFEMTTAEKWAANLLERLEERLRVSLDRARSLADGVASVLDVVGVVGVVSPFTCQRSVAARLGRQESAEALRLLRELAGAARFVCIELEVSPSEAA